MPRPLETRDAGGGGGGGGGGLSSLSLDGAGGGDGFGGETSRVVWAGAFAVVVVDGFGGETSRVVWAGAFDVVVDVLLLLDEVLLPLCPPDLATSLGGIRQTLGEDQTDQGTGPEGEARIAGAAQVASAEQAAWGAARAAQTVAGGNRVTHTPADPAAQACTRQQNQ